MILAFGGCVVAVSRDERLVRRKKALDGRLAGWGWTEIAERCGYNSRQAAQSDVARALAKATPSTEVGEDATRLQLARLDTLYRLHWPAALRGDLKAGHFILRVENIRRAVLESGAVQGAPSGEVTVLDEIAARRAARVAGAPRRVGA